MPTNVAGKLLRAGIIVTYNAREAAHSSRYSGEASAMHNTIESLHDSMARGKSEHKSLQNESMHRAGNIRS